MAKIISVINLKGGVGKTTTAVALAEMLSGEYYQKVLLIDLDPQTNATTMLIGEEKWLKLNEAGHTLAQLFKDALDPENRKFNLAKTLQKKVSNVRAVRSVDLLPSSLDLIDVQDRLVTMPSGKFYAENPTDILRRATKQIIENYDYVIVDCPPNLGIITLNGLAISMGYIIPTIPDVLSTYGIPQITKRVADFSRTIGEEIEPFGIVITKYRAQSTTHLNTVRSLRSGKDAPVFKRKISECNQAAAAAEFRPVSTLKQKWGYGEMKTFDEYFLLTNEIMERLK